MNANKAGNVVSSITDDSYGVRYPTADDLSGAAIGLLRLQDTYRLDTKDLADGKIYADQGNYTFSGKLKVIQTLSLSLILAKDCFEIARAAYNEHDFYHTVMWMEEAQRRLGDEVEPTVEVEDVSYLGWRGR